MTIQIRKATNGEYFVRLVANNNEKLAHSETYTRKSSAEHCANLIKREAGSATIEDLT